MRTRGSASLPGESATGGSRFRATFADARKRVPPRGEGNGRVALLRDLVGGKRPGSGRKTQAALPGVGEPEGAEGGEDLVGFLEVELGDVVVVEDDQHVVGDDGGVVPVEGAVEDDLAVDDALLGVDRGVGDVAVVDAVDERHREAGVAEAADGGEEGAVDFFVPGMGRPGVAFAREVAVEDEADVDAAVARADEGVDDAVAVGAAQFADQEEADGDVELGAVDLGEDGVVGEVEGAIEHLGLPEGVEEVEGGEGVDAVGLDDAAADGLEDVVEEAHDAAGPEGHAGFPVGAPAVEGDVEGADDGVFVAEGDEFVVHVGRDFGGGVARGADFAEEFDAGAFDGKVGVGVGEGHLAPVGDDLDGDAGGVGVQEVADEVGVVDAVDADFDGVVAVGLGVVAPDHGVEHVVDVALGMVGVPGLPFGEFGDDAQGFDVVVHPVDVALEDGGVAFDGAVGVGRGVQVGDVVELVAAVGGLLARHVEVFALGRDGVAVQVRDVGEFDADDAPLRPRRGVDVEVAGATAVGRRADVVGVGVDDVAVAGVVFVPHAQDDFDVQFGPPGAVEGDLPPAEEEQVPKVVAARKGAAKVGLGGVGVVFGVLHVVRNFGISGVRDFGFPGGGRKAG